MNKVSKFFRVIAALARQPYLLNKVLEDDSRWLSAVKRAGGKAGGLPVISFTDLLGAGPHELDVYTFLDGGSMVTDLLLLKGLAQKVPDCRYFEIGTWRGESVINVSAVAKICDTLNLSSQEIIEMGLGESYASLHGYLSRGKGNIRHLEGNSATFDFSGLGGPYDLIFIDGDHRYEMVKKDTESVFRHLVHDNSMVVWHDYGFSPEKIRNEVYAGILAGLPASKRGSLYHVSNTKCAVYLPGNWKTHEFITPQEPDYTFTVQATINSGKGK